ncbi:TPA: hypothetical protein HA244_05945 [Candidatus Micrarchaeota archaeon]|nr:hypothetical protein [Candidatus Micrarchaeota archaeon]
MAIGKNVMLVSAILIIAVFISGCIGDGTSANPTASATPVPTGISTSSPTPTPIQYPGGKIEEAIEKALA